MADAYGNKPVGPDALSLALSQIAVDSHWTDVNRGPSILHVVWSLLALSTLVVLIRLCIKLRKTKRLYWDDVIIIFALCLAYGHAICISRTVHYGLGRHLAFIPAAQREGALRTGFISLAFGHFAPMFGRISFCITLLYLTATDARMRAWPTIVIIGLQVLINAIAVGLVFGQCGNEIDILWTPGKQLLYYQKCWVATIQTKYGYFQGSFNTATDLYLTVVPALLIAHSRLSKKAKAELALFLCLSSLAMIASAVKTYEAKLLSALLDYTYDLYMFIVWMAVEYNMVMVASSMPVLRTLFIKDHSDASSRPAHYDVPMDSLWSRKSSRNHSKQMSSTSEEHLATPVEERDAGGHGIQVTREVMLTYETNDAPFVHAALLDDRVFIVTGGARGLGLTLAEALVEAGAHVYCVDRLPQPAEDFYQTQDRVSQFGVGSLQYRRVDVQHAAELNEAVASIAAERKRLDGLVAAAGVQYVCDALEYPSEKITEMMNINYGGVYLSAVACAREMIKYKCPGSMVLIGSMSGLIANKGLRSSVYNSSKAAVIQLGRSLAMEWGKVMDGRAIRVNVLCPGNILTPMVEKNFEDEPHLKKLWEEGNMMGRLSRPEEYRGAVLFMLSDASSFMTGSHLVIDGGYTAW
ncbi:hypothetical protein B0A48_07717 [Cryoendolithus antarcticus]|uniref:Rhodopsin domain-containing protein n=1 Tax=Cryoendolithus antarcticus TaxID=1507870 RepID=A0A1V8T761_9PEZI|nr:hypothetical protein B0A48_07717 [Cryoendolithus antarcticus]